MQILKHFLRRLVIRYIQSRGYDAYFAEKIFTELKRDLFQYKGTSLRQKIWALRRGFFSDKIDLYGLTPQNYKDYFPDLAYYRLFPINGMYGRWIDDKLTMRYILQPFAEYLPAYYFQIGSGEVLRLPDCPSRLSADLNGVVALLQEKRLIAAKPHAGSLGVGFVRLEYDGSAFSINDQPASAPDLEHLLQSWMSLPGGGYLLTEYLQPHPALSRIWSATANTLRIMVVRPRSHLPQVAGSFIRFGTRASGVVDNADAGGVICHVNLQEGTFTSAKVRHAGGWISCPVHPDTGKPVAGEIPFWHNIQEVLLQIASYIPQVIFMGFDVVITPLGFKIIEINSHQGLRILQSGTPIYKNEAARDFFNSLIPPRS